MKDPRLVFPDFNHNLVNISSSLAKWLGQPTEHNTIPALDQALTKPYRNVVYLIVDGMGSRILQKNLPEQSFLRRHQVDEVTSVFPTTTASATTSLISAQTPGQHGWFAWSVDFDGEVIELFLGRNFYTKAMVRDSDFGDKTFPYPYFFMQKPMDRTVHFLQKPSKRMIYGLMPRELCHAYQIPHYTTFMRVGQMFRRLHQICAAPDPKFVYAYFADLDTVMHQTGTQSPATRRLIRKLDRGMAKFARRHPDTLLVITADHGQIDLQGYVKIYEDREVMDCLEHPISLDPRGACFKIKPGMNQQFERAFQKYAADFVLYPSQTLVDQGVFGPHVRPEYRKYLGDYIAIGTQTNRMLVFAPGKEIRAHGRIYRGHHTGLTPDELYVPLIIAGGED